MIMGDLVQSGGTLDVNGGKLIVKGDYRIQTKDGDSYTSSSGMLRMKNEADHVLVEGDFTMDSGSDHEGSLTAGILELKGNFVQLWTTGGTGYKHFYATGTHKVLLSGTGPQAVSFQNAHPSHSHFNMLEITNPDPTKITFTPCWPAIVYSGGTSPLGNVNIGTVDFTLPMDMTIAPSAGAALWFYGAKLDLNGHTLTVEGDIVQSGGELNVNGGTLIVKGNYRLEGREIDGAVTTSSGMLKMINEADHVLVEGDFTMDSGSDHEGSLTAGILELKGNFVQLWTTGGTGYKNFYATGTHKVLLSRGEA